MDDFACLLDPDCNGVHELVSVPVGVKTAPHIDLTLCNGQAALLAEIGVVLNFPEYYGSNWDALEECLNDMSWHSGPIVLWLSGVNEATEANIATLREIFLDAASAWHAKGRACSLILTS